MTQKKENYATEVLMKVGFLKTKEHNENVTKVKIMNL